MTETTEELTGSTSTPTTTQPTPRVEKPEPGEHNYWLKLSAWHKSQMFSNEPPYVH